MGGGDDGFNPNTGAPPDPPDTTPPANVADLASSTTTTSSVDLTWTAPGDDLTAGTAAEYDIRYSTSVISDANYGSAPQAGSPPAPSAPGTSQTFSISGLDENTTYHFALQTADEVPNWSGLSNVTSATTLSSAPTPPEFVLGWGSSGSGDGQFDGASGIAVDGSGNVYVTDWLNHRVQKFDGEGTFLTKWGTQGSGDGQFEQPQGIAVDGSGNVYVADTENDRVQKFDGEGTFLTKWGIQGSGDGQFVGPCRHHGRRRRRRLCGGYQDPPHSEVRRHGDVPSQVGLTGLK